MPELTKIYSVGSWILQVQHMDNLRYAAAYWTLHSCIPDSCSYI